MSADGHLDVLEFARLVDEALEPTLLPRTSQLVRLGAYVRQHADVIMAAVEHSATCARPPPRKE